MNFFPLFFCVFLGTPPASVRSWVPADDTSVALSVKPSTDARQTPFAVWMDGGGWGWAVAWLQQRGSFSTTAPQRLDEAPVFFPLFFLGVPPGRASVGIADFALGIPLRAHPFPPPPLRRDFHSDRNGVGAAGGR